MSNGTAPTTGAAELRMRLLNHKSSGIVMTPNRVSMPTELFNEIRDALAATPPAQAERSETELAELVRQTLVDNGYDPAFNITTAEALAVVRALRARDGSGA